MSFRDDVLAETRPGARKDGTGAWMLDQPDLAEIVEALEDRTISTRRIWQLVQKRGYPYSLSALTNYRAERRWEK